MQRVHFIDPTGSPSWGLGFSLSPEQGRVGHSGGCPGYKTALALYPERRVATIVLANAGEQDAWRLAQRLADLLKKRGEHRFQDPAPAAGVALEDYAGRYDAQPWTAESIVAPWGGGLVRLRLPTDDPAGGLDVFKPKGGDVFRRIRTDGSEAEEVRFERDAAGLVVRMVQNANASARLGDLR
jgi:pimeloyl-ACP methyl ester carboxylesterase